MPSAGAGRRNAVTRPASGGFGLSRKAVIVPAGTGARGGSGGPAGRDRNCGSSASTGAGVAVGRGDVAGVVAGRGDATGVGRGATGWGRGAATDAGGGVA